MVVRAMGAVMEEEETAAAAAKVELAAVAKVLQSRQHP